MSKTVIGFWKPFHNYGCFSQWSSYGFKIDDVEYCCAEQYMMAEKARLFQDQNSLKKIMNSKDPKVIKALGSRVENFNNNTWDEHKYNIVLKGNIAKFIQNKDIQKILINTGNSIIAECSPYDYIWGVGTTSKNMNDWNGENLLGKALMETRSKLLNTWSD